MDQEKLKRYFWSLFGIVGIVFFWAGVWDGLGNLLYLENPLVSLGVGLVIIVVLAKVFKKLPWRESRKLVNKSLRQVGSHPRKHEFHIKYYDNFRKKQITFRANKLKKIEKSFLVLEDRQKEVFIPAHRIKEIKHKGKTHWKAD